MDLDRGTLAKIDRKVLSGLGHDENWQMVRVPVSEAVWSAWKRYCDTLGISMGRALSALVKHELRSVVDHADGRAVFLIELEDRLDERRAAIDARERSVADREHRIRESERRMRADPTPTRPPGGLTKIGRNDPCPCRSGLKYKRCHGQ
jgi:hypothetical protein